MKLVLDTTERKRAEEKLRRNEAYLAEGQRISHTGSWAWNVTTGDFFWSAEHFRIFGLDPEGVEPSYETFFQTVHPEDRAHVRQSFERAVRAKSDFAAEYRIFRPDGTIRNVQALAHPVFSETGEITEYVGTVIDITERRRGEEQLRQAQADLAHAMRVTMMGELAAAIAHEVNQPLGAIINNGRVCLRLLAGVPGLPEEAREALSDMVKDAARASAVIARLRELTRGACPQKAPVQLREVTTEVLALAAGELNRHAIVVETEWSEDLPCVAADRVQVQQVILNLVMNSIEAMSGIKDRERTLRITGEQGEWEGKPAVVITVRDSGCGLRPEDNERLFEPFYTTKLKGMGMGLHISRSIVEAHGGGLWATGGAGPGAKFHCVFPIENQVKTLCLSRSP